MDNLKICLDARLISGQSGGIEQAIIGLAYGLSSLGNGDEQYYFLTYDGFDDWLRPYIHGCCHIISVPAPALSKEISQPSKQRSWPLVRQIWDQFGPMIAGTRSIRPLPVSDGTIEGNKFDLMHFTFQRAFKTKIPSIYQPWDLQHRHLPELFTPRERLGRDIVFREFCQQAKIVIVASSWIKADLIEQYKVPESKIKVIPMAPALLAYTEPGTTQIELTRQKYSLKDDFLFYPAHTFKHKNHNILLQSIANLRDRSGLTISLVCSGRLTSYSSEIMRVVERLGLSEQVRFLGFVDVDELYALYKLARAVVFPSRYEGWGFPVTEAFTAGIPIACSNVTTLPEQAGDAALLFEPDNMNAISEAIFRVWTDETFRNQLIERGKRRVANYSWERTAHLYRIQYRLVAGHDLSEDDRLLLQEA